MIELDPKCFKKEVSFAVTNRGQLIPCCYCDNPRTLNDPKFQKLLEVSLINDYENIEDILKTKEWKQFIKDLENNIGPDACRRSCKKNKKPDEIQTTKVVNQF